MNTYGAAVKHRNATLHLRLRTNLIFVKIKRGRMMSPRMISTVRSGLC